MSVAWTPKKPLAVADPLIGRGAAAVGLLSDLPALERAAVGALRLWCDGAGGREKVGQDFARTLGPLRGAEAVRDLSGLIDGMLDGALRPLMRHARDCACVGCDENAFAHLVAAATAGDHDLAMAFALVLMTPASAYGALHCARGAGLALLAVTCNPGRDPATAPPSATRH